MVFGRRRVGKTYLLQRFFTEPDPSGEAKRCCYYLADQSTAEVQRLALARQLLETFSDSGYEPSEIAVSWNTLLRFAASMAREVGGSSRVGLVLDEFPYLVSQTPELPSILQAWWDTDGLHSPLFVVLCGSQLSFMAALGSETAPLFGRFNAGVLNVKPMRYDDVARFYDGHPGYGIVEKCLMYGVLGGTPRYHAMVDPERPWNEQVVDLLLRPGAPLETETRFLLSSEQIRDPAPYNAVLGAVAHGKTQYGEIASAAGIAGSALAHPLQTLIGLNWLEQQKPYGETTDRRSIYRLGDPFLAFWYRFVAPHLSAIQFTDANALFLNRIAPRLNDYMGWSVFEEICRQWLQRNAEHELGLTCLDSSRYWSRDGSIEIDIVADLDSDSRLFGECKWSANSKVGVDVYFALRDKVSRLPHRKWRDNAQYVVFSCGGFTHDLEDLASKDRTLHLISGEKLFS